MEKYILMLVFLLAQNLRDQLQTSETRGFVSFKQFLNKILTRTWTFHPPQNRTNVALSIDLISYYRLPLTIGGSRIDWPDGTHISNIQNSYLDNPLCRVFVKRATSGEVTCSSGANISKTCEQRAAEVQSWPPSISAVLEQYAILMYYEFVDCQEEETGSVWMPISTEAKKILSEAKDETTSFATTNSTTTQEWISTQRRITAQRWVTTQGWKESNVPSAEPASSSSESLLYTVIALSVLLAIALVLLAIASWKIRKLSRNARAETAYIAMNHFNDVTEQVTSGHESGAKPDVSSDYAMAEDGVGNVSDEKQSVDNELYQSTGKQDVINELYDCTS